MKSNVVSSLNYSSSFEYDIWLTKTNIQTIKQQTMSQAQRKGHSDCVDHTKMFNVSLRWQIDKQVGMRTKYFAIPQRSEKF